MTLADLVFIVMVTLQPPGKSVYSAVPMEPNVVCDTSYTKGCRMETVEEGAARYRILAQAIAEVSGGQRELAARLAAVAHGESGFRRDVMLGIGKHARGDKGMSWGPFQRLLGAGTTHRGWFGVDIVGTDLPSMRRAAATAAEDLLRGKNYCLHQVGSAEFACAVSVYGGLSTLPYASGDERSTPRKIDRRIIARVISHRKAVELLRKKKEPHFSVATFGKAEEL